VSITSRLRIYINSAICTFWFHLRGVHVGVVGCDGHLPILYNRGKVTIGKRFVMRSRIVPSEIGAALPGSELKVGDRVFVNHGATVIANCYIEIGDDTLIGEFTALYDTNHHPVDSAHPQKYEPIIVGSNVWLGRGVIVLPGSKIGNNSVVAAGSVVRGNIPADVLVAGNPAHPVKTLTIADGWRRKYGA
jgi:acetyltransferase-like isoleucine patch superfamily enzyme